MTWDTFHRRGEVLRAVVDATEARRDGVLPMEMPGVAETFGDELTLIGALQLRWHTRLAGSIERELMDQPMDLESAVMAAWRRTATEMTGVRRILDAYADAPTSEQMARTLTKAHRKDWALMASMAGKASPSDRAAADVGRSIEERARAAYRPVAVGRHRADDAEKAASLLHRIKAHLAA